MLDHRCSQRTDTRIPALLRLNGYWVPAVIRNVSEGGFFAETPIQISHREHAVIGVRLPRINGGSQEFDVLVIHRDQRGIGLMAMDSDEERLLSDYLRNPRATGTALPAAYR